MSIDDASEPPSKSELKRQATHAQEVGRRLAALKPEQLEQLELPAQLDAALRDYQRFSSHGARRRQLQFIGRLMRKLDTETLEGQLADLEGQSALARQRFAQLERWRERLISEPDSLTEYIAAYPDVDRQRLRQQLQKVARADDTQRKAEERALFRLLREFDAEHPRLESPQPQSHQPSE